MTDYQTFCSQNKERLEFQLMRCINDLTLHESYSIGSNVRCDGINFYLSTERVSVSFTRRDFRRRVAMLAKIFGRKPRLAATMNSLGYTRLIYKF